VWLGAAVVLTEAAIPPSLVLLAVLTERAVRPAALTQAFTWNNSASAAGSALAAALAGRAADAWGPSGALAQAPLAGLVLVALSLALCSRSIGRPLRRLRPVARAARSLRSFASRSVNQTTDLEAKDRSQEAG
jgi:hypothetical protein